MYKLISFQNKFEKFVLLQIIGYLKLGIPPNIISINVKWNLKFRQR